MIRPSCPVYVIHVPDEFRSRLVKALDETHFSVTMSDDEDGIDAAMTERKFNVVLVGVDLRARRGVKPLQYLYEHREQIQCGVIILGDPTPEIRTYAPWASETLLKPVDPTYVAARARSYCGC